MGTVIEIVRAAEKLSPADFLELRSALEKVEEQQWTRELVRVGAKHRKEKLTDAKIDAMVMKRRYKGRRS
jgi:hypothetical protein